MHSRRLQGIRSFTFYKTEAWLLLHHSNNPGHGRNNPLSLRSSGRNGGSSENNVRKMMPDMTVAPGTPQQVGRITWNAFLLKQGVIRKGQSSESRREKSHGSCPQQTGSELAEPSSSIYLLSWCDCLYSRPSLPVYAFGIHVEAANHRKVLPPTPKPNHVTDIGQLPAPIPGTDPADGVLYPLSLSPAVTGVSVYPSMKIDVWSP